MSSFKIRCPHCGRKLELEEEWRGMECTCPVCDRDFVVPADTPAPPPKPPVLTVSPPQLIRPVAPKTSNSTTPPPRINPPPQYTRPPAMPPPQYPRPPAMPPPQYNRPQPVSAPQCFTIQQIPSEATSGKSIEKWMFSVVGAGIVLLLVIVGIGALCSNQHCEAVVTNIKRLVGKKDYEEAEYEASQRELRRQVCSRIMLKITDLQYMDIDRILEEDVRTIISNAVFYSLPEIEAPHHDDYCNDYTVNPSIYGKTLKQLPSGTWLVRCKEHNRKVIWKNGTLTRE